MLCIIDNRTQYIVFARNALVSCVSAYLCLLQQDLKKVMVIASSFVALLKLFSYLCVIANHISMPVFNDEL